ncbi:hypothetical protein J3L18_05485 [Mucilaginibacter gossypii]|uniref:hypothetical protein n=1 Tax=Mucilaginibacter gossypii TaxID=551996 RepID=UPI000DCE9971|nr:MULTISPECIES: hypothetical protein [Mucilaginibacter]QTE38531.1 hypothetical protein J3L18_05485 [Mucilaginibacter gossypii]RAV55735.1 hypothetical protein DIU36_16725 [Mucilaginibacter rubeus]
MLHRNTYIKNLKKGEVLANLGKIQSIEEYVNCWVVTVKTYDNVTLAMKYPKSQILITVY